MMLKINAIFRYFDSMFINIEAMLLIIAMMLMNMEVIV